MKFVLIGVLAIFFCCQCSSTEAAGIGWRLKRSLERENCPANSTEQECLQYAREKNLVINRSCAKFEVTSGKTIEWQHCGATSCQINGREIPKQQDLSKPYPDCCPRCVISNVNLQGPTKIYSDGPLVISNVNLG